MNQVECLAWDCVAAGMKPPLQPTTCAVIRFVALLGAVSFRQMCEVIPCSEDALKQQVSRLVRSGVLDKVSTDSAGGKRRVYVLGPGGRRMVLTWIRERDRLLVKLRALIHGTTE